MLQHVPPAATVAVLTGDLIGSTKFDRARIDLTMELLGDDLRRTGAPWHWPVGGTRFTRFRGDGWQMLLRRPHLALRHALFLMAYVRAHPDTVPTRIAIGIGAVTHEGTDDLSDAAGDVFVTSGRCLDNMGSDERLSMLGGETAVGAEPTDAASVSRAEKAAVILLNERIARWTPEQAEASALYLHPDEPTLKDLATALGITPQAVGYRVRGAGAPTIREALRCLEPEWEQRWSR